MDRLNRLQTNSLDQAVAPVFVLIWSTGFIGARYGMPYAEPATFLVLRFGGVLALMIPLVLLLRIPWPSGRHARHIAVAGILIQGGYLLGVFEAIRQGMGAGLAALIVGLQPILTAILGSLVSERITRRQWLGLALGLAGVTMVVWERLSLDGLSALSVVAAVAALLFETRNVIWTTPLIGALLWSVLALSLGATSLLFLLIRRGVATKVASLMYLTPGVTALMAWILFGEHLSLTMVVGMAVTAAGVASMFRAVPVRR